MKTLYKTFLAIALGMFSLQAQALSITPDPVSPVGYTQLLPSCAPTDAACLAAQAEQDTKTINTYIESTYGVTELYKSDVVGDTIGTGTDSGAFAGSYDTDFTSSANDVSAAAITWNSPSGTINCPTCLLLVKDGNNTPKWYLFDLASWDGEVTINLSGFWEGESGAISHVSIYGAPGQVPEPGMVALLSIGLLGMVIARRKMKL